jgi:aminoglycoside phosphotransferase (APT) family kinase protein
MQMPIWEHLSSSPGERLTVEHCNIEPLPRRPGSRHVAAYHLLIHDRATGQTYPLTLIAKRDTTRGVGKAAREYAALTLLWDQGFAGEDRLRIPRPFDLLPDQNLILQESARGAKLTGYLGNNTETSITYARMAGLWLAKLHAIKVSPAVPCSYGAELSSLDLFVRELNAVQPSLLARVQKLAEAIRRRLISCTDGTASLVHGDYHPEHIFVADDSITVIDFERFGCGDRAKDVGSFLAHARSGCCLAGKPPEMADREIGAFLASYFRAVPSDTGAPIASRIAAFNAHSALEALYYVAAVLKVSDKHRLAPYLECAERSGVLSTRRLASRSRRSADSPQYWQAAPAGA